MLRRAAHVGLSPLEQRLVTSGRGYRIADIAGLITAHLGDPADVVPGLRLFSAEEVGQPTSTVAEASFAFVAQGAKQVAIGDHLLRYGPGDYLIVSVDLPVTGQFTSATKTEPFLGIGPTLNAEYIASLLMDESVTTREPRRHTPPKVALGTSSAPDELLDALWRLLRLLDSRDDRQALAPLIQREILWRLLRGPQGDLVRGVAAHGSALAQIGQAVRWIRTHYATPFRVEDLADMVAMSPPTFHRHFRAATTMSPIQYQKKIRLQQARLILFGSGVEVTRMAHEVGYESASQFSREYQREYQVSPSQDATLRRIDVSR